MSKNTILNKKEHADYKLVRGFNYNFCKSEPLCQVVMAELALAGSQAPIVFLKTPEEKFNLYAMQGFTAGSNYFVGQDGTWNSKYIPAKYRQYPFNLVSDPKNGNKVVCFDEDSNLVLKTPDADSVSLFEGDQKPSEFLDKTIKFLIEYETSRIQTESAISQIEATGLFEPWNLKLKTESDEKAINGLWTIKKSLLNTLSGSQLEALQKVNAIELIYAHLFSLTKVQDLMALNKPQEKQHKPSLKEQALEKQKESSDKELDSLVHNLLQED